MLSCVDASNCVTIVPIVETFSDRFSFTITSIANDDRADGVTVNFNLAIHFDLFYERGIPNEPILYTKFPLTITNCQVVSASLSPSAATPLWYNYMTNTNMVPMEFTSQHSPSCQYHGTISMTISPDQYTAPGSLYDDGELRAIEKGISIREIERTDNESTINLELWSQYFEMDLVDTIFSY